MKLKKTIHTPKHVRIPFFTTMSVQRWLSARQKDEKRIGFLKTGDKTVLDMLSPLRCAILSIPPEYGFALPGMELLRRWNIYNQTTLKEHFNDYTLLKDALRHPRRKDVGQTLKLHQGPFLNNALGGIIYLQTYEKAGWSIFDLMKLQNVLGDNQFLMVEVKPSDQSCHFLFAGPPRSNTLFILKEGSHFHGIKDPITFFSKYCDSHCCG